MLHAPGGFIPVLCHAKHGQSEGADGETTLKQLVRVRVRVIKDNETRVRFRVIKHRRITTLGLELG